MNNLLTHHVTLFVSDLYFVITQINERSEACDTIKTAIVLTPMSSLAKNTPMITVASSGAEEPAAMKVAPATSGDNRNSERKKIKICDVTHTHTHTLCAG